ncbi:MAG: hypothetical protein HFJ28_00965 [Clostridia bacterium]|nr:hypothetical protein [Clostridia bacterium]
MIQKKTFIITIILICIFFLGILAGFAFYHVSKIKELKKEKENITIIQNNNEITGLENVIVE